MKFTQNEIDNIINDYNNGMTPKEISIKYNRNSGTIIGKLQDLGVYKNTKYRFTKEDIDFLREHYPLGDFDSIFKRFPNASKQNIHSVCSKHKISADYYNDKKWTKDELDILEKYYYKKSLRELYDMLNNKHTMDAIQSKALKYFGYSKDRTWTDDEIHILHTYYSIESVDDVCKRLPNRTKQAIIKQANNFGIANCFYTNTYWTKSNEKLLYDNWKDMTDDELSVLIGKDKKSILNKRWSLGLLRFNHYENASYIDITKYIRGNIWDWKSQSMKNCNYKCIVTGSKDFQIHHLYSLSAIFNEVIEENNIILKTKFSDYTKEELDFILEKFIEKQNQYPLGICIRTDIHNLFHKIYGKVVTPDMWYEFVNNYNEGKYVS